MGLHFASRGDSYRALFIGQIVLHEVLDSTLMGQIWEHLGYGMSRPFQCGSEGA